MVTFRDLKEGKIKLVFGDPDQIEAIKIEEKRIKEGCGTDVGEDCPTCNGEGTIECEECNGEGVIVCNECEGRGEKI